MLWHFDRSAGWEPGGRLPPSYINRARQGSSWLVLWVYFFEVCEDPSVEPGFFFNLGFELGFEGGEAGGEVEAVFFAAEADVAAGGEDVAEFPDLRYGGGTAEAFDVPVGGGVFPPRVVGSGDALDAGGAQFPGAAVDEAA